MIDLGIHSQECNTCGLKLTVSKEFSKGSENSFIVEYRQALPEFPTLSSEDQPTPEEVYQATVGQPWENKVNAEIDNLIATQGSENIKTEEKRTPKGLLESKVVTVTRVPVSVEGSEEARTIKLRCPKCGRVTLEWRK